MKGGFMKQKNLKRYQSEFKYIESDELERLKNYLYTAKFTKKEIASIRRRMEEISNIESNYLKIVLNIIPEPTPRPRITQFGKFYVKNSKTNNDFVKMMVREDKELYHFITTPCIFQVDNYFPIPKSFSRQDTLLAELGLIEMITIPDWDNLGKTYSDMIQKWILSNDSLIVRGISNKHYSLKPRVEITITYKSEHSCKHNLKLVQQSTSFAKGVDLYENKSSKEKTL